MGRWILESRNTVESTCLEDHIEWLLDQLEAANANPRELPGVSRVDIFCYWRSLTGHGGPEFSPQLLGRLARLNLPLGLDVYFVDSSD